MKKWEEEKAELMQPLAEKDKTLCHKDNEQKLITAIEMIKKQHPLKDKITLSNAFPFMKKCGHASQGLGWGSFNEFEK